MNELKACEAVVFDAYGTLFNVDAPARTFLGERCDAVSELWRRKQLEYTWLRSLMDRYVDFAQVTAEALDFALAANRIDDPQLATQLLAAYRDLPVYGDGLAALRALRTAGRRTAILSNGSPAMLAAAVGHAGLDTALEMVLSAAEVGVYKPHPKVYRLASQRLNLPAEKICFVSANGWDASGASVFGFNVVRIDRQGAPEDRLPGRPVARIATLGELPSILGVAP
jgi:2-haloacid dehalogenase